MKSSRYVGLCAIVSAIACSSAETASDPDGGAATGGAATGGLSSGTGAVASGGDASGGSVSGTGAASASGGSTTGGVANSGGVSTGGGATGGAGTGGNATGGSSTGGSGTGGGGTNGPVTMGYILDLPNGTSDLDDLDYAVTDYVVHAFYTADGAGNVIQASGSDTNAYRTAGLVGKVHAAGKKILMSFGGANHTGPLKTVAASPALRATFVSNVVAKLNEWGYDGIDLDFEFPVGGSEPQQHLDLLSALYSAVKNNDANDVVVFGVSPGYYLNQYKWSQLGAVSDYAFYFCYDWDWPANGPMKNPGQTLAMFGGSPSIEASCRGALNYMLAQSYPASQIVVGLPFYANGGAHYANIPSNLKSLTPDANYMEVSDGNGGWWPTTKSIEMKMDAVLDGSKSVLTGSATVAGVGFWEWGYENPSAPDLSQAIKQKLGK